MINICVSCDENYAQHAATVIASVLTNAAADDNIHFYVLDGNISQDSKNKILSLKSIKDCIIDFIPVNESDFNDYKEIQTHNYISVAACYRLKLSSLLPNVSRVIYLDCDVIVCSSLKNLFDINLNDKIIGGVIDIDIKSKNTLNYINSGVLLIDLDKYRNNNIEGELLNYTRNNANNIELGDQEIINNVLYDRILNIDNSYNLQSECFIRRSDYVCKPVIIHFIGSKKPWHFASWSIHKDLYYKYRQLTPWKISKLNLILYWGLLNKIASFLTWFNHRPLFFLQTKFWKAVINTYFNRERENRCR